MPLFLVTNVCDEGLHENSFRVIEAPSRLAVAEYILRGPGPCWSRWLELRLPERKESRAASYVWPVCLILVGLVLLNYRES